MGCDIHAIWQARKDGNWIDVPCDWDQDRHYELFGFLADVRGWGAIAERRGLPIDFEIDVEFHPIKDREVVNKRRRRHTVDSFWMGDHSYSWLTADEILAAAYPTNLEYFMEYVRKMKEKYGEVRIVFGFDS